MFEIPWHTKQRARNSSNREETHENGENTRTFQSCRYQFFEWFRIVDSVLYTFLILPHRLIEVRFPESKTAIKWRTHNHKIDIDSTHRRLARMLRVLERMPKRLKECYTNTRNKNPIHGLYAIIGRIAPNTVVASQNQQNYRVGSNIYTCIRFTWNHSEVSLCAMTPFHKWF